MDPTTRQVFCSLDLASCEDAALVLRALGIGHRIEASDGWYLLLVSHDDELRALNELKEYREEHEHDADAPRPPPPAKMRASGWPGSMVYALVLAAVFLVVDSPDSAAWRGGKAHAGAIHAGEWWRAVTALTLHLDVGHLVGNIVFGGILAALLCRVTGYGVGWFIVLASGALGNLMNAFAKPAYFSSVGASTAVFGTLGALAIWEWLRGRKHYQSRARRWAPLVMAVVLLGYLGTSGERTDVLAHLTGFVAGLGLGGAYTRWLEPRGPGAAAQFALTLATPAVIAGCWWLAFQAW